MSLGTMQNTLNSHQATQDGLTLIMDNVLDTTTNTMTVPSTSIIGRKKIVDLTKDLSSNMGVNRIMTQSIYQLQDEFGVNGEPVWAVPTDILNQIRFVGGWTGTPTNNGQFAYSTTNSTVDYVEITFYGTGLSILTSSAAAVRSYAVAIDGGSSNNISINTASSSAILAARNYSQNVTVNLVTGLTLGIHTIKISLTSSASDIIAVYGFEVLNESTSITVNPGTYIVGGKRVTTSAQQTLAYNTTFESGTLGTKGGRVVVYQKSDGTIAKAVTPTDATPLYLSNAVHTNEEIARTYHWREFGAGRSDDFSLLAGSTSSRAFTLDDNTTTLVAQNASTNNVANTPETMFLNTTNDYWTFTFVGTGLDIERRDDVNGGSINQFTFYVDGVSIGTLADSSLYAVRNLKICSGLPYGTHTVKAIRNGTGLGCLGLRKLIVYQPKTPTLPTGAVALSDYNILANYDGSTITGTTVADAVQMPVGCILKTCTREWQYVGANWFISSVDGSIPQGFLTGLGAVNGQTATLVFEGTGFVLQMSGHTSTYDFSVTIDGSLNATGVARSNASNLTGGSYRSTNATNFMPCRIEFTGLAYGKHTITIQRTAGTGNFSFVSAHIITPIYSPKSNLYSDLQNTLPVGNQSIGDKRVLVKGWDSKKKNWAQAVLVGNTSTSSTSFVPLADTSCTINTNGGDLRISYSVSSYCSVSSATYTTVFVDGKQVGQTMRFDTAGPVLNMSQTVRVPVSIGCHKVDIYWKVNANTALTDTRILLVEEV